MKFEMVLASSLDGVIGQTDEAGIGSMPWKQSNDLKRFQSITKNHLVVYGRNTLESLPWPQGFPQRSNLVLTSKSSIGGVDTYCGELGCEFIRMCRNILIRDKLPPVIYIVGGSIVYAKALAELPISKIHHTIIHAELKTSNSDLAPDFDGFEEVSSEHYCSDDSNMYDYTFVTLEKNNGSETLQRS
tara:strand:+ start:2609 stop:3169 length:561 start_codon:yes stop_codon:yes gene_type:complete